MDFESNPVAFQRLLRQTASFVNLAVTPNSGKARIVTRKRLFSAAVRVGVARSPRVLDSSAIPRDTNGSESERGRWSELSNRMAADYGRRQGLGGASLEETHLSHDMSG